MATKDQVKEYYDKFKDHQKGLGINIRHRTIFKNLKNAGLKQNSTVLEIGCGIGTVSNLILKYITEGSFVGIDISPESIKLAKTFNEFHKKAEFIVNDMSNFTHTSTFDFVVFPDVLEHIPLEQHARIFESVSKITSPDATVLINIPEPNCLNWVRKNHPEELQIIDQSLSMQDLLNHTYPYGFKLYSMNPYSLQFDVDEYLSIILKKDLTVKQATLKSKLELAMRNTKSKLT